MKLITFVYADGSRTRQVVTWAEAIGLLGALVPIKGTTITIEDL